MKKLLWIAVSLVCIVMVTVQFPASAEEVSKTDTKGQFQTIDSNSDNQITVVEYQAFYNAQFDKLDANKDGVITPDEIIAKVTVYDKNSDNIVSKDEFIAYKAGDNARPPAPQEKKDAAKQAGNESNKSTFEQMDTNNDGVVVLHEYVIYNGNLFDDIDKDKNKDMTDSESENKAKENLNAMDANKDGKVSKDEYIFYWISAQKELSK
jgi:Ca2+-binding EF-hand superfamily protein